MWDLWWTKWHGQVFPRVLRFFPCQFHSTVAPLKGKSRKNLIIFLTVLHNKPSRLRCVRSICYGALQLKVLQNELKQCFCVTYRQDLTGKSVWFEQSMTGAISAVNFAMSRRLSQRLFRTFLHDLESDNGDTVYYPEARWLSQGKVLQHFCH